MSETQIQGISILLGIPKCEKSEFTVPYAGENRRTVCAVWLCDEQPNPKGQKGIFSLLHRLEVQEDVEKHYSRLLKFDSQILTIREIVHPTVPTANPTLSLVFSVLGSLSPQPTVRIPGITVAHCLIHFKASFHNPMIPLRSIPRPLVPALETCSNHGFPSPQAAHSKTAVVVHACVRKAPSRTPHLPSPSPQPSRTTIHFPSPSPHHTAVFLPHYADARRG